MLQPSSVLSPRILAGAPLVPYFPAPSSLAPDSLTPSSLPGYNVFMTSKPLAAAFAGGLLLLCLLTFTGCGMTVGGLKGRAAAYYSFMAGAAREGRYSSFVSPAFKRANGKDSIKQMDAMLDPSKLPPSSYGLATAADVAEAGGALSLASSFAKSGFAGNSAASSVSCLRATSRFFSRSAAIASKTFISPAGFTWYAPQSAGMITVSKRFSSRCQPSPRIFAIPSTTVKA